MKIKEILLYLSGFLRTTLKYLIDHVMEHIFAYFVIILLVGTLLINYNHKQIVKRNQENAMKIDSLIRITMEKSYFEGQKDALNEDIRIGFDVDDSIYVWIKSPWDSGKEPIFIPNKSNN